MKKFLKTNLKLIIIFSLFLSLFSFGNTAFANEFLSPTRLEVIKKLGDEDKEFILDLTLANKHKNEFTGLNKGKNLIVIQVESLQDFVIDKSYNGVEITPNLNKLVGAKGTIYFSDYMQNRGKGNTFDSEFTSLYSLYPNLKSPGLYMLKDIYKYGLPEMAKNKGYITQAMHGNEGSFYKRNEIYKKLSFDEVYLGEDFQGKEIIGMGISDGEFFEKSFEKIKAASEKGPFFSFLVTLSSHGPYDLPEKYKKIDLLEKDKNTEFGAYINSINYLDRVLGDFIEKLKKEGLYEKTSLVIYGDHYAMNIQTPSQKKSMESFLGKSYDFDEFMNVPLIITAPKLEKNIVRHNISSQVDLLPTILNLMSWNDETTVMYGVDILDKKLSKDNYLYPISYMLEGSFINDKELFEISRDGKFENSRYIARGGGNKIPVNKGLKRSQAAKKKIESSYTIIHLEALQRVKELAEYYRDGKKINKLSPEESVMHAGGRIAGMIYTNFKEAMDIHYKVGKRYFEIDFIETSDGKLVGAHSWDGFTKKYFDYDSVNLGKPSHKEFMSFKQVNGYSQLDTKTVKEWLKTHKEAFLITDIKENNLKHLKEEFSKDKNLIKQVIPQVYSFEEYKVLKNLGFEKIILTEYTKNYTSKELINFYKKEKPFAITIGIDNFEKHGKELLESGCELYVHTINNYDYAKSLIKRGVKGIYTDDL